MIGWRASGVSPAHRRIPVELNFKIGIPLCRSKVVQLIVHDRQPLRRKQLFGPESSFLGQYASWAGSAPSPKGVQRKLDNLPTMPTLLHHDVGAMGRTQQVVQDETYQGASIPKHLIEAAVARGQGRSATGAQLESMSLEVLMPPDIAMVIDAETDNKTRTLHDLRLVVKKCGGIVGSTTFYFTRCGRAVFKAKEGGPSLSDILDEAIEHEGLEDVEELSEGDFLAWTQPTALSAITEALSKKFELEVLDSDIVWAPNEETKVNVDTAVQVESLDLLFNGLKEYPEVKAIYANVRRGSVGEDEWDRVERNLDV
ncbi:hypothetical protein FZEAL_8476 [Fusarium zealandicum]|uniref:TACO1/YebC-like second and third domain-containing protein n=1 Tax=Fusarium zealandicum TaxID=1053134 RepID=A0A8H4UDN9_9HYPO|nr:hypothetical protein FZEAL_8476 [Fusarium zealandicum]